MQALYAYYQSDPKDIHRTEQELLNGTEKIFELYLSVLQLFLEIAHQEQMYYDDAPVSVITGKKKTASSTLRNLPLIHWLEIDKSFTDLIKKKKISWQQEIDTVKQVFNHLRQQEEYTKFTSLPSHTKEEEASFVKWLTRELYNKTDFIPHLLEEKNIYWAESLDMIDTMVNRTLETMKTEGKFQLLPLFKDEDDDIHFMQELVQKTIRDDSYFHQMISDKTKNWDTERIAMVDIILMKMALCEILNIATIPVKVSINEYIDISKDYSTPNSKAFINGVIDKLVIELKEQGKIHKTGRGLVE